MSVSPVDSTQCLAAYIVAHSEYVRPWIYGNIVSGFIYGIIATIYLSYVQFTRKQFRNFNSLFRTRHAWIPLGFATLLFILSTLFMAFALQKTVLLLSGPICDGLGMQTQPWYEASINEYAKNVYTLTSQGTGPVGNFCFVLTAWIADVLLLWRCITVYHDMGRMKWLIAAIPIGLQISSFVLGGFFYAGLSFENSNYVILLYYEFAALSQNVYLTVAIIWRLLIFRRRVRVAMGSKYGREYTNVAAMLTESQAMSLVANSVMVAFVSTDYYVAQGYPASTMYQILAQVQALAPLLIMYRVLQGKAWSRMMYTNLTKLQFNQENKSVVASVNSLETSSV